MQDYIFSNDFSRNIDAMIYTTKGKIYSLSEGDAFLITPNTAIYYEADQNDPWSYTWIGFQGIKMREYFERTSLLDHPCFHYDKDDQVRLCHEKMYEAYHLQKNRDFMLNSIMYEYLYLLATKYPQENIPIEMKKRSYVEDCLQYIENNYDHSFSIQEIADSLGLERSYLYRLFKNLTGFSPQEYLLDFRIRKACELLQNTDLPIIQIARSVGYEDSLYFSKFFKQHMNTSPSSYRQNKQKK